MKKISKLLLVLLMSLLLSACNKNDISESKVIKENNSDEISALGPTITSIPTPALEVIAEEYLAALETVNWTEFNQYVDEKASIRNSNLLNYGYLTYDEKGNIYFTDERAGGIYVSDCKGENKQLLSEDKGTMLQIEGEWLYYNSAVCGIDRINIATGEREHLYESKCGEFTIVDEGLFINTPDGLMLLDLEDNVTEVVLNREEIGFTQMSSGISKDSFLCNAYLSYSLVGNAELLWKGYLVNFDGEKLRLINQRGVFPLVAGSYISVVDASTDSRVVWNLETKEVTDLNAQTGQTVVSDGQSVYYKKIMHGDAKEGEAIPDKMNTFIFKWDGEELELLWQIDTDNLYYMFLTPKALYCLPQINIDGKYGYHLLYYDLETGETGQIY
ncbi:MAG: DUF5050 domain-containing protein [Lachnospiraceae bacterium]|nr:DUF5050 domain-containing protein [Lachnospiraceae bacterium]